MSGATVPGSAVYSGVAYIITCIMQNSATNSRHRARRWVCRRSVRAEPATSGTVPQPAHPTASTSCEGHVSAASQRIEARPVPALTRASIMPGTRCRAASVALVQAAQVRPDIWKYDRPTRRPSGSCSHVVQPAWPLGSPSRRAAGGGGAAANPDGAESEGMVAGRP